MTRFRFLELTVLLVLLGSATYEAAVALQWIPVGKEPGDDARFEGLVMSLALLAFLGGIVISIGLAARDRRSVVGALIPVAGAVMMIARYYTFDTYYLPSLTRYSEGSFSTSWVYGLAIASVSACVLSLVKPRIGAVTAVVVLFLCAFTVSFFGIGK